ncbi:hypothetical protein [Faecalimicrobium sp. JNUCC 81]
MEEELNILGNLLRKKQITYNEFNNLIGNYYVKEYEELEDNYYLIKVIRPSDSIDSSKNYYTDYVEVIGKIYTFTIR